MKYLKNKTFFRMFYIKIVKCKNCKKKKTYLLFLLVCVVRTRLPRIF